MIPDHFKMTFPVSASTRRRSLLAAALLFLLPTSTALASPAACGKNLVDKFLSADLVIEAEVVKSRRWKEGTTTLHLVAKYEVLDIFKGEVKKNTIQIVTDSCLEEKVPDEMIGYPPTSNYCLGGINLQLTGVDNKTGHPRAKGKDSPHWILFLNKVSRPGAPEVTWKEVPAASFLGECRRTKNEIPEGQQEGFRRLMEREEN